MEAKVGIEIENENILFKINKRSSLADTIASICKKKNIEPSESYGLKFSYTPNGVNEGNYVTGDNFEQIQNGFTLKLVESLDSIVDRIFPNMIYEREQTFEELFALSTDPGFIDVLVRKGRNRDVLQWLTDKYLAGKELSACLLTLLHLLKKQHIQELDPAVVQNILKCIKNDNPPTPPAQLQYALAVICQILYLRKHEEEKQMIISELAISDLIPLIWSREHPGLQLNTMMLINAMVKSVKRDKRVHLIKEMNRSKNREYIFSYVIKNKRVDNAMAHELYVYQTYVLSLHAGSLNNYIDRNSKTCKDMELAEDNRRRASGFVDFEEVSRSRCNSTDTILEDPDNIRISIASMESEKSNTDVFTSSPEGRINLLTYEGLAYYKKHYLKLFHQSRIEENTYRPGLLVTAENITRILSNYLHIGKHPVKNGQTYHPLVFNTTSKLPFFPELFSRTMWLFSKARKEMRAWTADDYPKALVVLEKQIQMILEKKPVDYNSLTKKMVDISYTDVDKQWQNEKDAEWKKVYEKNPCVQTLKKQFQVENEKLLFQSRVKTLQKGDVFPKLPEKKGKQQSFFLKLSDNKRTLFWGDWDETLSEFRCRDPNRFNISEIRHFIVGKACPHIKDHSVKHPDRTFSVILEDDTTINFLARDTTTANLWIDGFNLLLGKPDRSVNYSQELEVLQEMDCALQLLELQNVVLPNSPPEVPPLPSFTRPKPSIPPKSPNLKVRRTLNFLQARNPIYQRQTSLSQI